MLSPTQSFRLEEEEEEEIKSGLITVTHAVFTLTRGQYEETLTSLLELLHVASLRSTILEDKQIMFAHSETNHPGLGITEFTIEEILPTRTFSPESRRFITAFNVITHTSTKTDHRESNTSSNPFD